MKHGKKYLNAKKQITHDQQYPLGEAIELLRKVKYAKYDETVNLTVNLGVNPKYPDQMVRGTVTLPHGTGKTVRILVLASGEKVKEAQDAGADFAGGVELVEKIQNESWLDYDRVIATPDMMRHVGKLGKILGPRGLMPNPKVGTVTPNIAAAIQAAKGGQIEFKVDKQGIIHVATGKASFEGKQLFDNTLTVLNALLRAKPSTAKGVYMKKVTLNSTHGPGIRVDVNSVRSDVDEARRAHSA
ncbi:MAG: 50S ribosomal protein L1 [Candidatus Wallbacteria bacterium]|nr:50S ribosomal protein L1 [Candidatus Wallbacteria bacterium]